MSEREFPERPAHRRPEAAGAKTRAGEFDMPNRLFFRLHQCSNLLHKLGARYIQDFGATTQQWGVLSALARPRIDATGMTVKDLIEFLGVSRQNLTAVLDRLEERGWIERVVDENDGRRRKIRLSPLGKAAWRKMQKPVEAFYAAAIKDFSEDEQVGLDRLLDKLKSALGAV
jgi:MarR family transcriptional regulator, organic hydroperoxide resistance regulator